MILRVEHFPRFRILPALERGLAAQFRQRIAKQYPPLSVLVVNDHGYGMLRFDEDERFSEHFAVDLTTPDFVTLARSFGAKGRKTTTKKLAVDLAWGVKQRGPVVIELEARWAPPLTTSPRWPLKGKREARP